MAQPNWWEQDEIVQPAPQAGPIRSPVDPYKQAADARAARDQQIQEQRLVMDQAKIAADQEAQAKEQAEKDAKLARSQSSASLSLSSVLDKIDNIDLDVRDNGGWGETGKTGDWARRFIGSGTAGYDLAENIKTIDANSAFAALQQMRDNSPTGGALGQVTEKELDLLKSQISSLDPNQSQEQFLENLAIARSTYLDMLRRVDPAAAEAYEAKTTQDQGGDVAPQAGLTGRVTDDSPADTPPTSPPPPGGGNVMSDLATGVGQSVGDVIQAGGDMVGLVINPAHAAINAVTGAGLTTDFGSYLRDDLLGISHGNPTAEAITRGATAAFTGAGAARGIASALTPGLARNALATVGATPAIDAVAGAGAGFGGDLGRRSGIPGGEIVGALAGGIGGFGVASRAAAPRQANALMQAADDLGVQMLPADVGGTGTRMASGAVGRSLGGLPLAEGAERSIASAKGARNRIAGDIGEVADDAGAGQAARRGFKEFSRNSKDRADELYAGISVDPEMSVQLSNTRNALTEVTRGLESNPELSRLWANHPKLRATLESLTVRDTRQAGQVQLREATDKLTAAERRLAEVEETAARNTRFERSYADDNLRQAKNAYDDAVSAARKAVDDAEDAYDAVRSQNVSPARLNALRGEIENARTTYQALRSRDANNSASKPYLDAISKAEESANKARFSEVGGDELAAAKKELEAAQKARNEAFVQANQPPQGGQLSWQDMNRFRSIVGEVIGQPGVARDGSDIAALRKLYGALSSDMEVTAAQAGPKALREFRRANQYWRGRESRIEDVFQSLFGNRDQRSDEAVFKQINQWAKGGGGDFSRLARTIRSMPEDEAGIIRSTVVQRMGQAKNGRQDATGDVFSPAEFVTQWNGLSPRAKAVLFPSKQHRQDLDKFATLMDGMKRATEYQNFSNTSLGVNLTTQGALALIEPISAGALAGAQFGLGKLLASPRFARMLAKTANMPPRAAQRKFTEELGILATREPLLAADAKALQQHLQQSFAQSPVRAAASEEEQN